MGFKQEYDSKEELMFSYYVSELLGGGWIKSATYQPESFVLTEDIKAQVMIKKKNFNDIKDIKILNGHKYTADWVLEWDSKSHGIFFWQDMGVYDKGVFPYSKPSADKFIPFKADTDEYGKIFSLIDVKGEAIGRNNSSAITFPLNQKMLFDKEGLFVQKIIVSLGEKSIFARTFTPRTIIATEVYKRNCKFGKEGETKLKYEPILLEQWVKLKK